MGLKQVGVLIVVVENTQIKKVGISRSSASKNNMKVGVVLLKFVDSGST